MTTLHVGDRFIETTPSGRKQTLTVVDVDVEPKYRHGYKDRYVCLRRESDGRRFDMRETAVLTLEWLEFDGVPAEAEQP